jgi:hypothetical protein
MVQCSPQKEEWIREFWNYEITSMRDLITTYDDGYILLLQLILIIWQGIWIIKIGCEWRNTMGKKIGNGH